MQVPVWRAALVGAVAGATSGLFGVGGGVVIVPGLVLLAALDQRRAHGTSLAAILPIAAAGTIGYATAGEVDWVAALPLAAGALLGAPLGVWLLRRLPQAALRRGFAVVLVLTAVRMLVATPEGGGREAVTALSALGYGAGGLVSGVLAGLMGVGGGVIIVPLLTVVFGLPLVLAKGTSLAVIVPTAVMGTARNVAQGTADLKAGLVVGGFGVLTAAAASQLSLGLDPTVSAGLFAALLVVVAARLARRPRSAAGAEVTDVTSER